MKISVDLKYCYGIKALQSDFDFGTGNAFLVYAPNGAMKTSLAKVFTDISKEENDDRCKMLDQYYRAFECDPNANPEFEDWFKSMSRG